MCGIGGIVRTKEGKLPISEEQISMLLVGNEHRGVDATGIALSQYNGTVNVWKVDKPAWQAVCTEEYAAFIKAFLKPDTWAALCHTRAATQGNPRETKNNHPMFAGKSAVIHNGGIQNEQSLYAKHGVEAKADTDSDILRALLDKYGLTKQGAEALNEVFGSVAAAAVHPDYPRQLFLMRSGSPLQLAYDGDFFMWASEKNTLHGALRPTIKGFNLFWQMNKVTAGFQPFPDNTLWTFNEDGQQLHYEFNAFMGTYVDPKRRTYDGYKERQDAWTRAAGIARTADNVKNLQTEAKEYSSAWCSNCNQEWLIPKGDYEYKYTCNKAEGGCGKYLSPFPGDKK